MKNILVFMFFLLNFSTFSQEIKIPKGYKELKKVEGDLNKDGIKELVIAYDTGVEGDFGTEREVYVYKKSGDTFTLSRYNTTIKMTVDSKTAYINGKKTTM